MRSVAFKVFVGLLGVGLLVAGGAMVTAEKARPKHKVQNGVHVYARGVKPHLPKGAPRRAPHGPSKFGHKLVKVRGRLVWKKGTAHDVRAAEAKRLGKKSAAVKLDVVLCVMTGNMTCSNTGDCAGFCSAVYDPATGLYYCHCNPR